MRSKRDIVDEEKGFVCKNNSMRSVQSKYAWGKETPGSLESVTNGFDLETLSS